MTEIHNLLWNKTAIRHCKNVSNMQQNQTIIIPRMAEVNSNVKDNTLFRYHASPIRPLKQLIVPSKFHTQVLQTGHD